MPEDDAVTSSTHASAGEGSSVKEQSDLASSTENVERDEFGLAIRPKTISDQLAVPPDNADSDHDDGDGFRTPLGDAGVPEEEEVPPEDAAQREAGEHDPKEPAIIPNESEERPDDAKPTEPTAPETSDPPNPSGETELADQPPRSAGLVPNNPSSERNRKSVISEWSHMTLAPKAEEEAPKDDEGDWQEMPAYATHTIYDDWGKVLAKEEAELEEDNPYHNMGGAGKGYTKVQLDEDAKSATSMDDDTAYLFKQGQTTTLLEEDEEGRDVMQQMQATKDLLTEGQKIAYVGIVRIATMDMLAEIDRLDRTRGTRKYIEASLEDSRKWAQKMMVRLYGHMEINSAEQLMIEQLAEHGVQAVDLTDPLMQNARVRNPVNKDGVGQPTTENTQPSSSEIEDEDLKSPVLSQPDPPSDQDADGIPPPYDENADPDDAAALSASQIIAQKDIDIDLRWTVLCDLFLVLVADSSYDARSRALLESVGKALAVDWIDICRFEKRVTDALEMQEQAEKENWNEAEHMEQRQKSARNRRLMMMGLATVGGGLVIGLSAGLLAPVIGAGIAAGFTTIGVAGTSTFFGGAGAAALITSTGILTGANIGVRASSRRMGPVKTFEYRPLHNNKRVNLIVTVAGWMTGKVDDVRLPFSTVDPIMGDMYSVLWEPQMLQSMGQTINILATEALTQGLQQILGSTVLVALMGALQLPFALSKLAYLIDNPWNVSLARADTAGLILADSLMAKNLGSRPITLVGFSIGSRVIFSALKELAKKGAHGLVQNVYLYGSPMVVNKDDYIRARTIVPGRFVNGYAKNDWILGYLFRATSGGIMSVAGLMPIEVAGIENVDCTEDVPGHMTYRAAMPKLMQKAGWAVDSLTFSEIEDPDPDDHEKRQRQLINEIEEARQGLEKEPSKKGLLSLFNRNKKLAEKKEWETYDERIKADPTLDPEGPVMFDVDAIASEVVELAAHGIEIKEIKSTLPPMKLNVDNLPISPTYSAGGSSSFSPRPFSPSSGDETGDAPRPSLLSPDEIQPKTKRPWWSRRSSSLDASKTKTVAPAPAAPPVGVPGVREEPAEEVHRSAPAPAKTTPVAQEVKVQRNAWTDEDEFGHRASEEGEMTFE